MICHLTMPRFFKNQQVSFVGGSGIVKNHFLDAGNWMYLIEMNLGPEPKFGRLGMETSIILEQAELEEAIN